MSDRHPVGWAMAGLALVLLAGLYVVLLTRWPVGAGWVLSLVVAASVSSWVSGRTLRAENESLRKLHDAWNSSEKREDYADLGPVTGPTKTVELFDGARLAEWREQADQVRAYEAVRLCNNCGKHAVFAWEDEGFPFAACNLCVSLWFEDGLPEWVERIGGEEASSQVNQVEQPRPDDRPCSECGTTAAFCAQLVLSRDGLAGCCGPCGTTGTTHPALLDPRLIHLNAERRALNDWADQIHTDDDTATTSPRSLPGNGGNQ